MKTAAAFAFASLLLSSPLFAAPRATVKPVRSITVRVMPESSFFGRDETFRVTTLTATSCTVQVDQAAVSAQGDRLLSRAFLACLSATPEPKGCRTVKLEDGSRIRAILSPSGSWNKSTCDQGKLAKH